MTTTFAIDREHAIDWYRRNRARSQAIFDLIDPAAYYSRPIALRNPIVFYEGHLPAFSVIAFLRRGLGHAPVDARLEELFARGIDPESEQTAAPRSGASTLWPSRAEVQAFARACDEAVLAAIGNDQLPTEGLYTALEHEAMHQETLLYMWHRLPYEQKRRPERPARAGSDKADAYLPPEGGSHAIASGGAGHVIASGGAGARTDRGSWLPASAGRSEDGRHVRIPTGIATLGAARAEVAFGWDNEFEQHRVTVPGFEVDALPVTNADYMAFVEAGGYRTRELWGEEGWAWIQQDHVGHPMFWLQRKDDWCWRGMFEEIPLPASWPVYVSQAEADAYARWKGRRLMTEPEFHRAAYGTPSGEERPQPWGARLPDATLGHFDFSGFDPAPVGSFAAGASAWGIFDLVGNGWEWTSTVFGPFAGFYPMASYPEYSADFFDGRHYVMKGASAATARELIRRSFRNWFRGNYPYVYAKFRTAR
jgi:gamma-glutamyl hercynylcysteine S-oxide synthase